MSKLTAIQQRILQRELHQESKALNKHFCLLLEKAQKYLMNNCTCKSLVARVMTTTHVRAAFKDPSLNELKSATSTDDVICILVEKYLLSFLHYKLIEIIVTSSCNQSEEIKDLLKNYKKKFDEYIKRRVFETSLYSDGKFKVFTGSDSKETVELVIITDDNWNNYTPFLEVLDFESIIAEAFRCNKIVLALQSIKPQCRKCKFRMIHVLCDVVLTVMYSTLQQLQEKDLEMFFVLIKNTHQKV